MVDYREDVKWTVYIHIVPKELSGYDHDKYYVGITSREPKVRWNDGYGYYGQVFYNAIKKYGWDNIMHEIIAERLTKEEACNFEKVLIKTLHSNQNNYGYNKTLGGEGTSYEYEDLTGKIFGHLRVNNLSKETGNNGERKWDCICLLCSNTTTKYESSLKSGHTTSCGCYGQSCYRTCSIKHGLSYKKIYQKFSDLKRKCYNKNCKSYKRYGKKGVTVCKEWMDDFETFYNWSINNGYSDDKVLYLKDGYFEFSPDNCLWVSKRELEMLIGNTEKRKKRITYKDETHTIQEWAEIMGTTKSRLSDAFRKKTFEEAFLFYTNRKETHL